MEWVSLNGFKGSFMQKGHRKPTTIPSTTGLPLPCLVLRFFQQLHLSKPD